MARVRDDVRERRYQLFIRELARTNDPVEAAKLSGHPAERALETLRDLGFTLTAVQPKTEAA
jgi:hypothetical protein